uniref:Deoxyguanosine kinase n=1 Tax=Catharus ustulatus TaxID=91951 RepID=A0A8C3UL20_CATUS
MRPTLSPLPPALLWTASHFHKSQPRPQPPPLRSPRCFRPSAHFPRDDVTGRWRARGSSGGMGRCGAALSVRGLCQPAADDVPGASPLVLHLPDLLVHQPAEGNAGGFLP